MGDSFLGLQVDQDYRMQRSSTGRAYSTSLLWFIFTGLTNCCIIHSNDRMVLEQRLKGLGKLSTYHSSHESISHSHKMGFMQASKVLLSAISLQVFCSVGLCASLCLCAHASLVLICLFHTKHHPKLHLLTYSSIYLNLLLYIWHISGFCHHLCQPTVRAILDISNKTYRTKGIILLHQVKLTSIQNDF
jgi:hypothetical protein